MSLSRTSLFAVAIIAAVLAPTQSAHASLIVTESFDYGGSNLGTIAGQNGGTGFDTAWALTLGGTDTSSYQAAGLTFSDLTVSGGKVSVGSPAFTVAGRRTFSRELGVTQTGTIWGSFLFSTSDAGQPGSALIIDDINNPMDAQGTFGLFPTRDGQPQGKTILNNGSQDYAGGVNISAATTYLQLFKMTNLGPGSVSHTLDSWTLTEAQFDNFKAGGITEAELNAATLGTGATQVQQRQSRSGTFVGTFSTTDFLALNVVGNSVTSEFDEIRISDTSLAEVTPNAGVAPPTIVADLGGDWVNSSTLPTNWEYLGANAATGGTENSLTPNTVIGNGGNTGFGGAGDNDFKLTAVLGSINGGAEFEIFTDGQLNGGVQGTDLLVHPSQGTSEQYAIMRYTLTAADLLNGSDATIEGSFRNLVGGGDSVTGLIYHNGDLIFSANGNDAGGTDGDTGRLSQVDGTFNLMRVVAIGDTISFIVFQNGSRGADETAVRATIGLSGGSAIPAPAALPAGLAMIGIFAARRRR